MNDLFKFALSSQTIYGGIQFLLFTISLGAVIGALQHYHANDRVTFNCYPKPGDFTKQVCYDKYISTVSPWLIPRNIAGITYAVVFACWICFMLYAAVTLRQIKREQAEQNRRRRQLRKFLQMYCLHVGFRLVFLGAMIGLFCSYQTLNLPSVFKCDPPVPQTNTTSTPVYQTETGLQCNDLHYKEKSNLNIAIIVIKSSILMLGILEVIHLSLARETFQKKLLGDMQIDMEDWHRVSERDVEPMLNRSQATNENTVNKTDSEAHKQGRRRRRLKKKEEEKKKRIRRKNAERGPPAALHDAQEREQKEIKEGLLQLRHELKNYDFQKCPRIKKEAFQDLDLHDIDLVRIAVIGPTGSGKTSLIKSVRICIEVEGTTGGRPQGNYQGPPTELNIWKVILSFKDSFNLLLVYLRDRLGVGIASHDKGSLLITVTCSSLQILEGLWEDYESGHLNEVAEQKLVTAQVLEKLHLREVKLKTTISKEDYQKCKELFLGSDQRMEDDEQRRELDRQKREREEKERKRQEEKGLPQRRHELMNYDFQKCPRITKEAFKDLEVDDIEVIRIAVIGFIGAGITTLIGTLQRALEEPQTAIRSMLRGWGTIILEEHYVQKQIRLIDTRGSFETDEQLEEEWFKIFSGRIRPGEEIVRNYDKEGKQEPNTAARLAPALSKYAHAVIFVMKANDPRLKDGKYKDTLQKIREHFREDGYAPVAVITYLDKLKEKEDKDEAFDQASWATGASSERTYFIANYVHVDAEQSFEVDRTALDILDSVLLSAERFIRIRKQREKNQMEREVMAGASKGVESVEQFFVRLQKKYNWTDQGKKKAVLEKLRKEEVKTVNSLKELWEDIKSELPLTMGMRVALEEEMKHI